MNSITSTTTLFAGKPVSLGDRIMTNISGFAFGGRAVALSVSAIQKAVYDADVDPYTVEAINPTFSTATSWAGITTTDGSEWIFSPPQTTSLGRASNAGAVTIAGTVIDIASLAVTAYASGYLEINAPVRFSATLAAVLTLTLTVAVGAGAATTYDTFALTVALGASGGITLVTQIPVTAGLVYTIKSRGIITLGAATVAIGAGNIYTSLQN